MSPKRRSRIHLTAAAVSSLAMACPGTALSAQAPARAASPMQEERPSPGVWVAYSAGGVASSTTPNGDGTEIVSQGDLRWPIFSVRRNSQGKDGNAEADLLTPGGFDPDHVLTGDLDRDELSGDPYSDSKHRERKLEHALMHHRPVMRLRIDARGQPKVESSPELRHHEGCAQNLIRAAIEAQLAAAEEEEHREDRREQLRSKDLARRVSPPLDSASLLLRLAHLQLPSFGGDLGPAYRAEGSDPGRSQRDWRAMQISSHGRPVRSEINLLSAADSPAARLCRSLSFESTAAMRSDTCIIQGAIDRRDGWPIRMTVSRRGEAADGATERQSRSFDRLAPLQGFAAPANPCTAGR